MQSRIHAVAALFALLTGTVLNCHPATHTFAESADLFPAIQKPIADNYEKIPLCFELNEGQVPPSVQFIMRGSGYTLFLSLFQRERAIF